MGETVSPGERPVREGDCSGTRAVKELGAWGNSSVSIRVLSRPTFRSVAPAQVMRVLGNRRPGIGRDLVILESDLAKVAVRKIGRPPKKKRKTR